MNDDKRSLFFFFFLFLVQAFNVCGDTPIDNGQVAAAVAQEFGLAPDAMQWDPALWAIANKRVFMDNRKAKRVLGFAPKCDYDCGCAAC